MKKFIVLFGVLIIFGLSGIALAYDADHYGFNYHLVNKSGDTRVATAESSYWTEQMGYDTYKLDNYSASTAYSYATVDTIWVSVGHANAGIMEFMSSDGSLSYFGAHGTNTSTHKYISQYSSTDIDQIALMFFGGCYTGNNDSNGYNLLTEAKNKNVDSAVGYTGEPDVYKWDEYFEILWEQLDSGDAVAIGLSDAKNSYYKTYGSYDYFNTYKVEGKGQGPFIIAGGVQISPAKEGYID